MEGSINTFGRITRASWFSIDFLCQIAEGLLESGSLCKLKTLIIIGCPSLRRLLSGEMTQHLAKLQDLRIENCNGIECIIEVDAELSELSALRMLRLVNLPALVTICANDELTWPLLEKIEIARCDNPRSLPFHKENARRLKTIECTEDWWNALGLENDTER